MTDVDDVDLLAGDPPLPGGEARPFAGGPAPGPAEDGGAAPPSESGRGAEAPEAGLSGRLTAVARLIQIGTARAGPDGFSPDLLRDAEELLARAGERLRMSSAHTVVVLAGGTGSGKSSLFNRLAGADFSPAGVTRPVTRDPHACVWGMSGAGPLLEWLGVSPRLRYERSSALGAGETTLDGLLLLDLPDHDSVLAASRQVDRLIRLADLMVWVGDPQKYADAAMHSRYLEPLAGHASVIAVALNQADLLTPQEADDCLADLRRLLDAEGLHDAPLLLTSAREGTGVDELRKLLAETVSARRSAVERIEADLDAIVERFAASVRPATGAAAPESQDQPAPEGLEPAVMDTLVGALAKAAGVDGVGRALQSALELRAVDHVGWPVAWLTQRLAGRDPVRRARLGSLWDQLRGVVAGPAGAQQAEVDSAVAAAADQVGQQVPEPWVTTARAAARSRSGDIPAALGEAVAESLPPENRVLLWWRLAAVWQGLLLGCAVSALGWLGAILAFGVVGAARAPSLFSDVTLLPWAVAIVAGLLLLGWLSAAGFMNLVVVAATRERARSEQRMRAKAAQVARELVAVPVEQELSEYARFREALATARGRP